ncbi:MAG: hypothetical protein J6M23_06550 [Bacteroidales bacterium]|nr:hypothetical protein [Bacteroidales bacterium]
MTAPAICLLVILSAALAGLFLLLFIPQKDGETTSAPSGREDISVGGGGSIVTVRKIGPITSVTIRQRVNDHWDGQDGVAVPLLGPEAAKRYEPALWNEYMNPRTSAVRKYEIIDEVYALGFTLPYIKGLNEQYKREMREALASGDPDGRTVSERTPVNLTRNEKDDTGEDEPKKMQINEALYHAPVPDMNADGADEPDNQ